MDREKIKNLQEEIEKIELEFLDKLEEEEE